MAHQTYASSFENDVSNAIIAANGVNSVSRGVGGVDRELQIDLNPTLMGGRCNAFRFYKQLKAVQQEASGDQGCVGGERQSIRSNSKNSR